MEARVHYARVAPGIYEAMLGLMSYLRKSGLDESLVNLISLRASQINGCAYCIDMHWKDLKAAGETDQKLYGLDAWTESVTNLSDGHVPDEVYERVRGVFTEKELADLTFAIAAINGWNRLNIAARTPAGAYRPAKSRAA